MENDISIEVALQYNDGYNATVYSFVNNIITPEGGTHEDGVRLVRNRGIYMEQEVPAGIGAMAAVIGLTSDEVDSVLAKYNKDKSGNTESDNDMYPDTVSAANYNCPGQIVISGKKECVQEAMEVLKEAGARRTLLLNVSGPFHSKLLKGAGDKLMKDLEKVTFDKVLPDAFAFLALSAFLRALLHDFLKSLSFSLRLASLIKSMESSEAKSPNA